MRTASLCHRLSNLGVTAVTRAYVVPTAACTVTVCPAGGSTALTIFQAETLLSCTAGIISTCIPAYPNCTTRIS